MKANVFRLVLCWEEGAADGALGCWVFLTADAVKLTVGLDWSILGYTLIFLYGSEVLT